MNCKVIKKLAPPPPFLYGVIQKVRSLRRGGRGAVEKWTKTNRGVLAYVYIRLKKNAEIFKMKFYSYSPVFPIDYNGSMKLNKPSWKIIIFSPVNEWRAIVFSSPHKITNAGYGKIVYFLRRTLFGSSNENFAFETRCKADTGTIKPFS